MRFYLASGIENQKNARFFSQKLKNAGFEQTFDWTRNLVTGDFFEHRKDYKRAALQEFNGIDFCDIFIALLPGGQGTHVEMGIAMGMLKPIIIASQSNEESKNENLCPFYCLPGVKILCQPDINSLSEATISYLEEMWPCALNEEKEITKIHAIKTTHIQKHNGGSL